VIKVTYKAFIEEYLAKGLIKKQRPRAVEFVNLIKDIIKKENPQAELKF